VYAGNNVEQGGLAGPVRTDDADDPVRLDGNIDSSQRDNAAKFFTKSGNLQVRHFFGRRLSPSVRRQALINIEQSGTDAAWEKQDHHQQTNPISDPGIDRIQMHDFR
jgi:hypothetical protein